MMNVSLARIMYGTSEDLHASHSMNVMRNPSPVNQAATSAVGTKAVGTTSGTLGGLLHKAWVTLRVKD